MVKKVKLPQHAVKFIKILETFGHEVRQSFQSSEKTQWRAFCPHHSETQPSLSISLEKDGRILLFCHGGCETEDILDTMELHYRNLFPEKLWVKRYGYNHTDAGNAQRFAMQHKGKILYCWDRKKWLVYDGKRWNPETGEARAVKFAIETARSILDEIRKDYTEKQKKEICSWSFKSEGDYGVRAMLRLARAQPGICAYSRQFDQEDYLFNCSNGTIDLETGILERHNPEDLITKLAPVRYPAEIGEIAEINTRKSRLWLQCLRQWMQEDKDQIDYLCRSAGYWLTGDITSRVFPVFHGTGRNGKSTFLDTLIGMMGDYASIAPETLLKLSHSDRHPTEIADLEGKRLMAASETKANMKLKISLVKAATGDRIMKGRGMRQDYYEFKQTTKIVLMTQNLPKIDETTDAIWDRVHRVEWSYRVPARKQDTHLLDKLQKEWCWVLVWAVHGCLKWQKEGILRPTEQIVTATESYRKQENPVKEFLDECCRRKKGGVIINKRLWGNYQDWLRDNRKYSEQISQKEFSSCLKQLGYEQRLQRVEGKVVRCWLGLAIN